MLLLGGQWSYPQKHENMGENQLVGQGVEFPLEHIHQECRESSR